MTRVSSASLLAVLYAIAAATSYNNPCVVKNCAMTPVRTSYSNCVIRSCVYPTWVGGTRGFPGTGTGGPRYTDQYSGWVGLRFGCGCHEYGSRNAVCDIITGQCQCRIHVSGRACDSCIPGFWGLSSEGCHPCHCDPAGSLNNTCDIKSGQCVCKPGVGGMKCASCLPGYYGFSINGCSRCEQCDKVGHICDPDTGRCVCPPFTHGATCNQCQPNSWGFEPGKGCKPCQCSRNGALHLQCDLTSGHCTCKQGFEGIHCDRCSVGYYGLPNCQPCNCNISGTVTGKCDAVTGKCLCDDTGQCPCKSNVEGKRCDRCRNGTFGLQADNIEGCTQCFCFGRTTLCSQAGLIWGQILAGHSRSLTLEHTSTTRFWSNNRISYIQGTAPGVGDINYQGAQVFLNISNNLQLIPGTRGDVRIGVNEPFDAPLYWQLPKQFLGDRILSYGGFLQFTIETVEASNQLPPHHLSTYPLIQIQGHDRITLQHYPFQKSPSGTYKVRFHESLWRLKNDRKGRVTREWFMLALQNIQQILIRASDWFDFSKVVIHDVTLDTAVEVQGTAYPLANGIELCKCPSEYSSSSCQDPSIGFYRYYDPNHATSTIVIQLVGEARPCDCNNRSKICDTETGYCLNCSGNTGGPHCEKCGEGYYGDPNRGSCLACPCPYPQRNFAHNCHVVHNSVTCFCREGYTGRYCDSCSYGWYGYPRLEGGSCKPCTCSPYGSVSYECDEETGQCNCKPGIGGRDCTQCTGRTVLTERGCQSCGDNCTGLLLNQLDELSARLQSGVSHISSGIVPPPWHLLRSVNNTYSALNAQLNDWQDAVRRLATLPLDITRSMKRDATRLLHKAEKLNTNSKRRASDALTLYNDARDLVNLLNIENLAKEIYNVVSTLQQFGDEHVGPVSIASALEEARRLLERIKSQKFDTQKSAAQGVLNKAVHQLDYIESHLGSILDGIDLKEKLSQFLDRLDNLDNILRNVTEKIKEIERVSTENKGKLTQSKIYAKELKPLEEEVKELLRDGYRLNEKAERILEEAESYLNKRANCLTNLKNLTELAEEREGILFRLNPVYREKYVIPALLHADLLTEKAEKYKRLFDPTRHNASYALRASNAYRDIVDALQTAMEAAQNASDAAENAYETAFPMNDDNILDKSLVSVANSNRLLSRGKQKKEDIKILNEELEDKRDILEHIRVNVRSAAEENNVISKDVTKLNNKEGAAHQSARDVLVEMNDVSGKSKQIHKEASETINKTDSVLYPLLENLTTILHLSKIEKEVDESIDNIRQSEILLSKLNEEKEEGRRRFENMHDSLTNKMEELRNKIKKARHIADGIHVSMKSPVDGEEGCIRSYIINKLEPSTTTSIVLNYAIDSSKRDGVLLYLPSSTTGDFVALEIVNGHIRFVWDMGGGEEFVEHPMEVVPESFTDDSGWYRIQIDRTSNIVKLIVRPQDKPELSKVVNGSSKAGHGVFDVGPNDRVWIGGIPSLLVRQPKGLKSVNRRGLVGCLYQVLWDGRPLGLWNFANQIYAKKCGGCIQGFEELRDEVSYRFNGEGYSSLQRTGSRAFNKYIFVVSFKFRTLDENALLFYAVDPVKQGSVSITLNDGKVVYTVGYGGKSKFKKETPEKHNNGKWIIVEATRFFDKSKKLEKCQLKVDGVAQDGAPDDRPTPQEIPDLSSAFYFVGGIPPGFSSGVNKIDITNSFLGCMSDIAVNQEGYNPMQGQFYGIEASCKFQPEVVSFEGNGFLQLPSYSLKNGSSFGFSFRTYQENAILLLTTFKGTSLSNITDSHYYSVSLFNSRLSVFVNNGKRNINLTSESTLNDGKFHAITVTVTGRRVELRVDDDPKDKQSLPKRGVVKAPGAVGGLFLGGVPTVGANSMSASTEPLIGTIKDVIFNDKIIQFHEPISFEHAAIGRVYELPAPMVDNSVSPLAFSMGTEEKECQKIENYSLEPGAVKFGDALHSHVEIIHRTAVHKHVVLELYFRTFYPNGLLFIIPSSRTKQRNFLMASLQDKQVNIMIKLKRKPQIVPSPPLNDGEWHHIVLTKADRQLTVEIDSSPPKTSRAKFPKKLNLGNIMYVGGLPESNLMLPELLIQKHEGFKGCIKNLAINKQSQDLVGEKTRHFNVGQCFPRVEQGSYFPGDAYAIYKNKFYVGALLELELQFRTSELTGILLSVSEPQGYPALSLEINNGRVIMIGDTGDRRPFRVEQGYTSPYALCNNKWHTIKAFFLNDELILKLDNLNNTYGHAVNGQFQEAMTNSPLYIGGLPDGAPTGTLVSRDNFKGCIRNIVIGGNRKDWTDMAALHNVLLSSCPIS